MPCRFVGSCRPGSRWRWFAGATVIETLFVLSAVLVVGSLTIASLAEWRARTRSLGAARLVMGQVRLARAMAVREGVAVGLLFREEDRDIRLRLHRDGNGNGLRRDEIERGIDPPVGSEIALGDWFAGTALRIPATLPGPESSGLLTEGSHPVRLSGGGTILSCSPSGTTSSGTVYVAGARGEALAVRVLGATGRLRLLEYAPATASWQQRW